MNTRFVRCAMLALIVLGAAGTIGCTTAQQQAAGVQPITIASALDFAQVMVDAPDFTPEQQRVGREAVEVLRDFNARQMAGQNILTVASLGELLSALDRSGALPAKYSSALQAVASKFSLASPENPLTLVDVATIVLAVRNAAATP